MASPPSNQTVEQRCRRRAGRSVDPRSNNANWTDALRGDAPPCRVRRHRRPTDAPPRLGAWLMKDTEGEGFEPPSPFKDRLIEMVRAGRTPEELAERFEPTAQSIRNWVALAAGFDIALV